MLTNFPPRFAALAAAALLSMTSSARADASFAAALSAPLPGLESMAQLKALPQKPALAPAAQEDRWLKLATLVYQTGEKRPEPGSALASYYLREEAGGPDGRKIVDSVNLLAATVDGKLKLVGAQIIHMEAYAASAGRVIIDISVFEVDGFGRLKKAIHEQKVKAPDAEWTSTGPVKQDINGAGIKAEFEELMDWWMPG